MDLEYEQALERILAAVPVPGAETAALTEAHGRILAEEVVSTTDLPGFDNSAMDGYGVRAQDVAGAGESSPVRLRVVGRVAAGEAFTGQVSPGTCVRLFTGSALPAGADAVVMQEDTRADAAAADMIDVLDAAGPGQYVRRRGEDVPRGMMLARAGEELTIGRIALLAASGCARVRVGRRPSVAVLATGSELKEPGESLLPGQIYECNRSSLAGLSRAAGAVPVVFPIVRDDLQATRAALERAFSACDLVVCSGGVSVGDLDFVKQALPGIGGELQFWRVAIKPGRPFAFGRAEGKLFFGLPGNPVSAFVTFALLVRPALLRFQGAADVALSDGPGVAGELLENPGSRRHFLRVRIDGTGRVYSAGAQASHNLTSLAAANALADLPPRTTLPPGAAVKVLRLDRC